MIMPRVRRPAQLEQCHGVKVMNCVFFCDFKIILNRPVHVAARRFLKKHGGHTR